MGTWEGRPFDPPPRLDESKSRQGLRVGYPPLLVGANDPRCPLAMIIWHAAAAAAAACFTSIPCQLQIQLHQLQPVLRSRTPIMKSELLTRLVLVHESDRIRKVQLLGAPSLHMATSMSGCTSIVHLIPSAHIQLHKKEAFRQNCSCLDCKQIFDLP